MYDNVIDEWTTDEGYRVRIMQDYGDVGNSREWDNLGTMACWHGRYDLGDEQPSESPSEYLEGLPEGTVILPLYLYDHGGLTMSTSAFSSSWDSGQVGIIYVTPETMVQEMVDTEDAARTMLIHEVNTYDLYLRGEVFYYTVDKPIECDHGDTHWEHVDGCGGYLGYTDTLAEVKSEWPEREKVEA